MRAAAVELLLESNFEDITTKQVADRARVGDATLFRYRSRLGSQLRCVMVAEANLCWVWISLHLLLAAPTQRHAVPEGRVRPRQRTGATSSGPGDCTFDSSRRFCSTVSEPLSCDPT
ncbi:TetR family transcriptional regulator [Mycolicibacterium setense]